KTDSIIVWGKCEMCKSKIEKASTDAGAASASWNKKTQLLVVSYHASKTSNSAIQKKIASVGYDTQDEKAPDASYNNLEKCCQYKRANADTTGMKDMKGMNNMSMNCMAMMSSTKNINCTKEDCCNNDCTSNVVRILHHARYAASQAIAAKQSLAKDIIILVLPAPFRKEWEE